jgi:hypothetical protein
VTGPEDEQPAEEPEEEYDLTPVIDALGWARAVGIRLWTFEDSPAVDLYCPGCRTSLTVAAEPHRPAEAGRRIEAFVVHHEQHAYGWEEY